MCVCVLWFVFSLVLYSIKVCNFRVIFSILNIELEFIPQEHFKYLFLHNIVVIFDGDDGGMVTQ